MKAEKKLKLSIEALDNFGVRPEIIKDMLNDLDQVLLDKKSEKIAKEHFRKQRDNGLIELKDCTKPTCDVCGSTDISENPHMGRNCNWCNPLGERRNK